MEQLTIDTGLREYAVNGGPEHGGGVLRFNPSDPNVYSRFCTLQNQLQELEQQVQAQSPTGTDAIQLLAQADQRAKGLLAEVFGPGNDFDAMLGGTNLLAVAGNGDLAVVLGGTPGLLRFWIGKSDFWQFRNGRDGTGIARTAVFQIQTPNFDDAAWHVEQDMDRGELRGSFRSDDRSVTFRCIVCAVENTILWECSGCAPYAVSLEIPPSDDGCVHRHVVWRTAVRRSGADRVQYHRLRPETSAGRNPFRRADPAVRSFLRHQSRIPVLPGNDRRAGGGV